MFPSRQSPWTLSSKAAPPYWFWVPWVKLHLQLSYMVPRQCHFKGPVNTHEDCFLCQHMFILWYQLCVVLTVNHSDDLLKYQTGQVLYLDQVAISYTCLSTQCLPVTGGMLGIYRACKTHNLSSHGLIEVSQRKTGCVRYSQCYEIVWGQFLSY